MTTLGTFFGSFARRADGRVHDADLPDTVDDAALTVPQAAAAPTSPAAAAVLPAVVPGAAAPRTERYLSSSLADARRDLDAQARRMEELEEQLRSTLERLGRRTTEVRNLEARMKVLDPMVGQVRQRDQWLDEARTETRKALAERDAEAERRKSFEGELAAVRAELAAVRKEIDWRDYVIKDLEAMPDRLREQEHLVAQLRKDHAAALAARDAEIARLKAQADEQTRSSTAAAA